MPGVPVTIRPATEADDAALAELEKATRLPTVSPAEYHPQAFFGSTRPHEVLVAELSGRVVGYVEVRPPTPLPSNAHVLAVEGLAVSADVRGQGIAQQLLAAVEERAAERSAVRVTLRVLAPNGPARALYEKLGYRVEGVLAGEFRLPVGPDGSVQPVDDILMAKAL